MLKSTIKKININFVRYRVPYLNVTPQKHKKNINFKIINNNFLISLTKRVKEISN